jgi:hypothetical protein
VSRVLLLALTAALNPTLLTATTVMLLLPRPSRLMLGYWCGAMLTSVTIGLVIVFSLSNSSAVSTTKHTLSPIADLALGALFLAIAFVLGTGRHGNFAQRRAEKRAGAEPPKWQQKLSRGTARSTFVIGCMLTLPGASYLLGLDRIHHLDLSTAETVLTVIGFNLVMLILLEVPIIAFTVAPDRTVVELDRGKGWLRRHGLKAAVWFLATMGALLVLKGIVGLV